MFKTLLTTLACSLLLAGCSSPKADGYTFDKAEYVEAQFSTVVIPVQSREQLLRLAPAGTERAGTELMAFAKINRAEHRCTIYVVDARVDYQPQWLGHELAHCIYGNWHKDQQGGVA